MMTANIALFIRAGPPSPSSDFSRDILARRSVAALDATRLTNPRPAVQGNPGRTLLGRGRGGKDGSSVHSKVRQSRPGGRKWLHSKVWPRKDH